MTPARFTAAGAGHAYAELGLPASTGTPHVVWGHGWGRSRADFLPLAGSLARRAHHTVLDFPGFGDSPRPPEDWSTEAYADALAEWLPTVPASRLVYVGHSFGGRVGLRLAARHPALVQGMVLAGTAGLRRRRSPLQRLRLWLRVRAFKALKLLDRVGVDTARYRTSFGSADYRNAGAMRAIFVKAANEDQSDSVKAIAAPTVLIVGDGDVDAPLDIAERLAGLIPGARLMRLPGLDHHTVLTDGAPQIVAAVAGLLERP